jgi:hypothetical protein
MKRYVWSIISLFASIAGAAEVPVSEITYVAPWPTIVDVQMNTAAVDPENCGGGTPTLLYRIDLAGSDAQPKVATLLAAFAMGKPVGLVTSGCVGNSPKIIAIRLYQ